MSEQCPSFSGGRNIAIEVPPHQREATVAFYRNVLSLEELDPVDSDPPSVGFAFGANRLWIDRVRTATQAELWLQVTTDDTAAAARHLTAAGVVRCDDVEPLPAGSQGFWVTSPAAVVHLVSPPNAE